MFDKFVRFVGVMPKLENQFFNQIRFLINSAVISRTCVGLPFRTFRKVSQNTYTQYRFSASTPSVHHCPCWANLVRKSVRKSHCVDSDFFLCLLLLVSLHSFFVLFSFLFVFFFLPVDFSFVYGLRMVRFTNYLVKSN